MNHWNKRRSFLALAAVAACALLPALARADSDKRQEAKEHYEMATRFYDVGKYGEAINEYEQAYLLIEDAALLFNIGQAYRLWDKPEEAIRSYKNYLRRRPEASNRADVEKKLADLEKVVEDRHRGATASPSPILPVPAPAEPSTTEPTLATPAPAQTSPSLGWPAAAPLAGASAESTAQPAGSPEVAGQLAPAPGPPPAPRRNWLAYSLIGAGGACLVGSGIALYLGHSKAQKMQDASIQGKPFDPAIQNNGKSANAVAAVAILAGVASGTVGAILLWRGRGTAPTASVAAIVMPGFSGGSATVTF